MIICRFFQEKKLLKLSQIAVNFPREVFFLKCFLLSFSSFFLGLWTGHSDYCLNLFGGRGTLEMKVGPLTWGCLCIVAVICFKALVFCSVNAI